MTSPQPKLPDRRPQARRAGRIVLALLALAGIAGTPARAQSDELADARARWEAADLDGYEYGYRKYCECNRESPPETVVTVSDGVVTRVRHRPVGSDRELEADAEDLQWYWTVDELFGLIERARERESTVRASFDDALGYPLTLYIDHDADLIGDEVDLRLTGVRRTGG